MKKRRPAKNEILDPRSMLDHPALKAILAKMEPVTLRINLSDATSAPRRASSPPRPAKHHLESLVTEAASMITFNGGDPTRHYVKRQHIDGLSYSYGILWGIACALDRPLREVVDHFRSRARSVTTVEP
ncbi:MAG TPA: hypothetical protein VMJ10_21825 [Kofleriaceae bacterium]|nr:hypothetical protein [Kofleriaceae bacterium]